MKKNLMRLLGGLMALVLLLGGVAIAEAEEEYLIGICLNNITNPYRVVDFDNGVVWFEDHPNFSYVYTAAANDVTTQIADMEDLIARGCDAIIINCINEDSMRATLELAKESGIPVFAWDRDITNTDLRVGVVKKDNYSDYYNLGVNIAEDLNGEGKVAFLLGFAGNSVTEEAHAGLLDAFADYPDIEVVYTGYCNNSRADALTMFESVYLANRDITCVVGETDEVALGVLQVLKAEGRDDILVYGHDGQKEAYEAIINGEMMATAANPMDLLYTAIEMTANYLETGTIEEDVIYVPTVYVDSENVEEMYDPDSPF